MGRLQFAVKDFCALARRDEEVAVETFEVAIDLFFQSDLFNPIDRRGVTLRGELRPFFAVHALDFHVAIVDGGGQMGGGPLGHAAADPSVIQDRHRLAFPGKKIGGGHAGDAGADNAYLGMDVFGKW